jgi:hypothetical protein
MENMRSDRYDVPARPDEQPPPTKKSNGAKTIAIAAIIGATIVGLAVVGAVGKNSNSPTPTSVSGTEYAALDSVMNADPTDMGAICRNYREARAQGVSDDTLFNAVEESKALTDLKSGAGVVSLTDRQVFDYVVNRC